MRGRSGRIAVAVASAVLLMTPVRADAAGHRERIDSYDVALVVRPDGGLHVAERIRYDFGTGSGHHGIDRWIPERARQDSRHERVLSISGLRVSSPYGPAGASTVTEDGGRQNLRIGDPDRTVSGVQTYAIDYDVGGALTRDAHGIHLLWNAVGTAWKVPITRATVTVRSPAPLTGARCVAGHEHDTTPCGHAAYEGTTASFTTAGLRAHAGLTVRVGLPENAVPVAAPRMVALTAPFAVTRFTTAGAAVAGGLLVLAAWWFLPRRRRGRGRPRRKDRRVPPGLARVLVNDRQGDRIGLAATLVDLAVRGHIRLTLSRLRKEEYQVVVAREDVSEEGLLGLERLLLTQMFQRGDSVSLGMVWHLAPQGPLCEDLERATVEAGYYRRTRSAQWVQALFLAWTLGIAGVVLLLLAFTSASFAGAGWVALTPLPIVPAVLAMGRWTVPRRAAGARAEARAAAWREEVAGGPPHDTAALSRTFPYAVAFEQQTDWGTPLAAQALRGELAWFTVAKPRSRSRSRSLKIGPSEVAARICGLSGVWPRPVRSSVRRRSGGSGSFSHSSYGSDSSSGGGMSVGDGGGGGGGGSW